MPRYISRVYVIVDADDADHASDILSATLQHDLPQDSSVIDWCFTRDPLGKSPTNNGFTYPVELTPPHALIEDYREEDVDVIFQAAQLVNRR